MNFISLPSYERKRIGGKKKVNEFHFARRVAPGGDQARREAGLDPGRARKLRFSVLLIIIMLARRLCPLELYRDSVQGGAVGSESYLMVVEIHDAAVIRTLTSLVAASRLAAGAFFP